ncbi:type III secretion system protein SpaR [Pandoraea pulmonicola]|nr:type III secretion system protein SpaR [Pandoraea pulmonicola]
MSPHLEQSVLCVALGLARIGPALLFVPLFGEKALAPGLLRSAMIALISLSLLPVLAPTAQTLSDIPLLSTVLKEATIGLVLGFMFGAPYFAALTCGEILDNQRGATIAKAIDPAAGVEASILATLMGFLWTVTFALGGGLLHLLETLAASYRQIPIESALTFDANTLYGTARLLGQALLAGIAAAMPALAAMLLVEISLGVLSRFAPQLNPFSVAMTLKSLVACLILLLYFSGEAPRFLYNRFDNWSLPTLFQGDL